VLILYVVLSFTIGFALGMFTIAVLIGRVVRQHGGRYTYVLPTPEQAELPDTPPTAAIPVTTNKAGLNSP